MQRIRRQAGLKVRPQPKKMPRRGVSIGLPTQATHRHHVWTWDFIFDRIDRGATLKMMTLLDEYTRQCLAIQVERQITATRVLTVLERAMDQYEVPAYIRSDTTAPSLSPEKSNKGYATTTRSGTCVTQGNRIGRILVGCTQFFLH